MNPSAQGWIEKFAFIVKDKDFPYPSQQVLYRKLRSYGFIYGANIRVGKFLDIDNELTEDEMAKVNLLTALYSTYQFHSPKEQPLNFDLFLEEVLDFYSKLEIEKASFLASLFTDNKPSAKLEKIIHQRVHVMENLLTKNFSKLLTNSLLFVDVLMFVYYLEGGSDIQLQAKKLERILMSLAFYAIDAKQVKTENDNQLLKLFSASLLYHDMEDHPIVNTYKDDLKGSYSSSERQYFIDIVSLAAWEDHEIEYTESDFIKEIALVLELDQDVVKDAINHVAVFFEKHKDSVSLFKTANPILQFFENSHQLVRRLIKRNSKRLLRELSESKELIYLLSKSTTTELTDQERRKIKEQLLDIFKSIPSLAIFALPGGAILLPIFIKLIPTLLPSAFDDNRVKKS